MSTEFLIAMIFLAVLGGYVLTSLLLLRFPTLLHTKKKTKFVCRHISHRGGAGEKLENTMAAFRHAVTMGTDMLELDCQLTSDDKVVVSHDDVLSRSTGREITISKTSYQDLPQLKSSLKLDFYQTWTCDGCDDRRIPLLEEVFQEFPDIPINIDIKTENLQLMERIQELILKYKREDLTVWGNFRDSVCQKAFVMNRDVPLLFSFRQVLKVVILFYTGLLPFVPIKESFFEVMMPGTILRDGHFHTVFNRKQRALVWFSDIVLMNSALIKHLTSRGIQVYLWVLNDEEDWHRAFRLGATGVMTDFPSKLTEFLELNKQYNSIKL